MTFSIVAFDPATQSWGVAVASKFLAVGALVPWGSAGAGAVATQAMANLSYGPRGLELLARGAPAEAVVKELTAADPERDHRQVGVVDSFGAAATFTGASCHEWAGGVTGEEFAAQGNILKGPGVVDAVARAYRSSTEDFARRLLGALAAGDEAGGDRRGRQSAALRVWRAGAAYGGELDLALDLRVDDDAAPVAELQRLLALHELYFGTPDPATLLALEGELAVRVTEALKVLGYEGAAALESWAGVENFEERLVPGKIDPLVWEQLQGKAERA
ncbi:MAG: DUF1028 domain-containing protein [Actinomycetota bacterium]|nr:DUF1028 domain-containing protein [Actinomycetota bacterium]